MSHRSAISVLTGSLRVGDLSLFSHAILSFPSFSPSIEVKVGLSTCFCQEHTPAFSHAYMEANVCDDGLPNIGLTSPLNTFVWLHTIPSPPFIFCTSFLFTMNIELLQFLLLK